MVIACFPFRFQGPLLRRSVYRWRQWSKVTSILGHSTGCVGYPDKLEPSKACVNPLMGLSAQKHFLCMSTDVWLSAAVENIWTLLCGDRCVPLDQFGEDPSKGLLPRDNGVTSKEHKVLYFPSGKDPSLYGRTTIATHSIGSIPLSTGFPMESPSTNFWTMGIL